ncbi:hypothetical protein BHE74_00057400 [Ensete ventricosum]|nr:hypothetical protein BHE74_00057400 [Ensete ventricosum]
MRLYRVESFYAFLLYFRSEGSEEEGQLATASPYAGPATHAAKAPCKGTVGCGQGQPEREASGAYRPIAGCPQGAATRGQSYSQQGWRRQPQGWPPLGRVTASRQGQPPPLQGQWQRRQRWCRGGKRG